MIINGHFDLARQLLDRHADPTAQSQNGVTPLYTILNCQWAPKALYPQPRAHEQQRTSYLDLMSALLDRGADPNARLKPKVWSIRVTTPISPAWTSKVRPPSGVPPTPAMSTR